MRGTLAERYADKKAKNRQAKGSAHGAAKLTEEVIPEIRRLLAMGFTQAYLASIYGADPSQISKIKPGKIWNHVEKGGTK